MEGEGGSLVAVRRNLVKRGLAMTFHTAGNIGGSVHAVRDNMDPTQPRDSKCKRCPLAIFIALFLRRKGQLKTLQTWFLLFLSLVTRLHSLPSFQCDVQMPAAGALQGGATMVREPS